MTLQQAKKTAQAAYAACHSMLEKPELSAVVNNGLTICYGPVRFKPDLALITFQGGGADRTIQERPPANFLYAEDPYRFGSAVRRFSQEVGMLETIRHNSIAHPVVFPQDPTSEAGKWMAARGPRATWRDFSLKLLDQLLTAQKPRAVMVFGEKASRLLGIEWSEKQHNHPQGHMTFGRGRWKDTPSIYCHHLSIGCPSAEARRCFLEASKIIGD